MCVEVDVDQFDASNSKQELRMVTPTVDHARRSDNPMC